MPPAFDTTLLALALLPFAGALLPALAKRAFGADVAATAGLVSLGALALALSAAPAALAGTTHVARWPWVAQLDLEFALRWDGLACLFALLITGIGTLVIAYSRWYLEPAQRTPRFYGLLLLFMGAMLGIVLAENLLLLAVCWELTSIASFLLIGYRGGEAESRQGARLALLVTGAGGLALLAGLLLLGDFAGSRAVSDVIAAGDAIRAEPLYPLALVLVLLGAFTKSAQFPFHFWLPQAMAAPTPVSAYLHSATMVKAGIFLMMRLYPALGGTPEWFWLVAATGATTLLFASAVALYRHDLKGLLAYSTLSHLGLIVLLMGLGTPLGEVAAVFHVINHAVFKASLFMAAGIVDHATGTRDMRRLSGLARHMPHTAALAIVAAAAMAGVPLLNGFLSKEMFFAETLSLAGGRPLALLFPAAAVLAGVFTVAYSTRFVHDVFFGGPAHDLEPPHEAPRWLRVPVEVLVLVCVVVGLAPGYTVEPLLRAAAAAVLQQPLPPFTLGLWHGWNAPLLMSAVALAGGFALYFQRRYRAGLHAHVPSRLQGRNLAEAALESLYGGAALVWPGLAGGGLQRQVLVLVVSALLVGLVGWQGQALAGVLSATAGLAPAAAAAGAALVAATLAAAALHRQRHAALLFVGLVGLVVALAFAGLSAPDLALTQVLVEIVTLLLLLLALRWLPAETPREPAGATALLHAAVALGAGAGAAALAWAMLTRPQQTISGYYTATAPVAGGDNVVNVILVDFRGFDTLGEIAVLGIAALAVGALLRGLRLRPGSESSAPVVRSLPLAVIAPPLLALALLLALWLFLRGHDAPGGGFIAGLVTAAALFVRCLAGGADAFASRGAPRALLVLGLGTALLTGLGSLPFGHPFLTSSTPVLQLPLLGELKLPSATLFDAGVYFVVVGAVLAILARFATLRAEARD